MDTLQDGTSDFEPERPTHNNHGEESGSVIKKPATLLSSSNFKHQNSAGNHRSFWKTFLEGSTSFIRHTAFATYIKPVLADAGDDFSNNLLSDLAPVLALFGEQVAKQFMSQSMLWLDNVIFACAPLGIITAVVCAIRVGGPTWMKAVIGRAREGTGVVEVELMSSTSEDVCELWNRESIVRCLGTSPIIELYYLEPEDKQQYNSYKTSLGWCLARRIKIKLRSLYGWARDKGDSSYYADRHETGDSVPDDGIYDFKTARKHKMLRCYNPTIDTNTALSSTSKVAPNIAINLTGKHVSQWELAMVATIGILIQIGVLVFAGLSVLLDPFNNRFKKNEKPIEKHALPTMITGTVALVIGMYICSHVVERSTWEEKWNMVPPAGYRLKVAWVQKGGEVNDQLFESYFIPRATSPGSLDDSVPMIISRKKEKQSSQTSLTILAVFISMAGFIIQFVGLRGLNWSVAIAQLTATGIMTILRAILRRNMAYKIKDSIQITAGQELDMVAKNIKRCNHWNVIACGLDKEKANGPQSTPGTGTDGDTEAATPNLQEYTYTTKNLASKVYSSRYRLGILSKWESQWKDTVKNTTLAIETAMNFFCSGTNSDFKLEKNAKFKTERSENKATIEKFEWELIIESQSSEFSDRYIYETIVLTLTRKLLPGRGWSTWTADKKQIECVLGLWMHHLTNNAKDIPTTEPVDATSETEPFENSNRLFRMLGADGFSNNVYEQWICCQPKNVPERLHTTEQLQTIIARPTPKNYDIPESGILVVQLDVPLQNLCGQVLLSEFLRKVVACISIKVRNQVRVGEKRRKSDFGLKNSVVDELADKLERTHLMSTEEAYIYIVPVLDAAGKLPSDLDFKKTIEEVEIQLGLQRWEEAKTLLMWLLDILEGAIQDLVGQKDWKGALRLYLKLCEVSSLENDNSWDFQSQVEEDTGIFCQRWLAYVYLESSSIPWDAQNFLDLSTEIKDTVKSTMTKNEHPRWLDACSRWENKLLLSVLDESLGQHWGSPSSNALCLAAEWGDIYRVAELIKFDPGYLFDTDEQGRTPLILAANAGHAAVVSLILDNSIANVAQIDKFGKTALHYAAERGYSAIIRTIARSDHRSISEILRQDLTFEMPSESAQRSSAHSTADLLLFYGARLEDITDRRHPSSDSDPLSLTPITSFSCKVASHSIGIPRPGRSQTVCFFGDWPIFSDMASAKREILETQLDCNGIFFSALKRRTQSGVRGMLSIFPDLIGARDGVKNNTALHIAIKMCNEPAVVELLGRPGLDLVARNEDGHTPLRLAAHNDFIYFTQLILRVLLKQYFDLYLEEWMSIFESIKLLKRRCSDVMFQHLVFCVSDDRWADLLHKQTPAESMDSGTAEIGEITEDSPIISSMLKNLKSRMYHTKVERILRSVVTPPRCYTNLVKPLLNCFTEWGPAIERALSEPEGKAEIIMLGHISKGARTEDFAEVFEYARKNEHDKMMEFCLEAWDRNYVEREKRQGLLDHINEKKYTDLFSLLTSRLK